MWLMWLCRYGYTGLTFVLFSFLGVQWSSICLGIYICLVERGGQAATEQPSGTEPHGGGGGNVHVMGITSLERRESLVDTRWKLVLHYRESGVAQGRGIAHGQGHWVLSRYCIARAHSKLEQNSKIFNTVHGVFTDSSVCGKKGTIHQELETS
ncbi:hypothetical protein F5883DRAFT_209541 [Diaporthe sp. PMI_573]|nr:hypothetical protein F5883DRAFT_209541 [Diaporthaceae sp. PMI_573]